MAGTYLDEDTMSADGLMHAVSHVNGLAVTAEGGDEGVWVGFLRWNEPAFGC